MFKKIISPIQAWLLAQGKCVGCGASLAAGKKTPLKENSFKVSCKCGRVFVYNSANQKYRRALFEEI